MSFSGKEKFAENLSEVSQAAGSADYSLRLWAQPSLETYHTPLGGQFDQFRRSAQGHVGVEIFLAHLASFGAGGSDVDRYFVFHQIG